MGHVEVVEPALVEVRQVPEDADVLKAKVVPLIIVGVVWHCVFVYVLSFQEGAADSDQLPAVNLTWSASLISELSWNPSTVDNDGRAVNLDWVVIQIHKAFHGDLTSLVAVEWIDDIEACLPVLLSWDEDFFRVIKLTDEEVRLESMVDYPLFVRHPPPSEIELLPWGAILNDLFELVMTF